MAVPTITLPEARNALSGAAGRLADLLRSLPDVRAPIPGSRWTAGDAAAHVVMNMRTEALVAAGEAVSWAQGATSAPGTPRGVAELNARAVTAEAERDPRALADMLVTAVSDFLAASAKPPPPRSSDAQPVLPGPDGA
jgi:Mycothiol maleylpyruvate isomerase N-terminal domain